MLTTQEVFETIYRDKIWGGRRRFWKRFHSGSGSVGREVIEPYVAAASHVVRGRDVVDIGCGDFSVGRRICGFARRYIACDIVRPLIDYNTRRFKRLPGVEFRVVDAAADPLPDGEIVLLRQVLQHLDNCSISKILPKLQRYSAAIVTEHVPANEFKPNVDMPVGPGNRTLIGSGVVLTAPPFDLRARTRVLCEVPRHGDLIRTYLYEF
jgi:SAM-dependent methyltransferase